MAESSVMLKEGHRADVWIARKKRWGRTYRFIYDAGEAVIFENLGSAFKQPLHWYGLGLEKKEFRHRTCRR